MTRCNRCLTGPFRTQNAMKFFSCDLPPGVSGAHDLRTRQSGPTRFIQIHIEMEDNLPLVQAHVIAEQVEQAILQRFPVQTSLFTGSLLGCTRTRGAFVIGCKSEPASILCINYRHLV